MNNKSKPIFGLDKLPDEAIIKELRIELGKTNSYIDELEEQLKEFDKLKQYFNLEMKKHKKEFLKEFKLSELLNDYKTQINNLEIKNKDLRRTNEELIYKLVNSNK